VYERYTIDVSASVSITPLLNEQRIPTRKQTVPLGTLYGLGHAA